MAGSNSALIRPLRTSDKDAWSTLWHAYLKFYDSSLSSEIYDMTFNRLLDDDIQDLCGLIAEVNGKPVGLVHFLYHRHCWRVENVCYLQDLYADPAVRGQGIGRKLIEAVYAAADVAGAPAVYWMTQEDNAVGRRLYDRVGKVTNFIKYQRPA